MRLFIALPLPGVVREPLAATAARLRAGVPPARWVPVSNLHLTLRFLGEVDGERVGGLDGLLSGCFADHDAFSLRLCGGGCFPPRRPARVAWVGFEPSPALADLQSAVAVTVDDHLGLPRERRPFHPHLTLARPRRPWPRAVVDRWVEAFDGPQGPAFEVAEAHLMRSRLGPSGARHDSLGAYPLRRGGGDGV